MPTHKTHPLYADCLSLEISERSWDSGMLAECPGDLLSHELHVTVQVSDGASNLLSFAWLAE